MYQNLLKNKLVIFMLVIPLLLVFCSDKGTEPVDSDVITIDINDTRQIIRGFGGINVPGWIPDLTAEQVHLAFGSDSGQIGMSILRVRISFDQTEFHLELPTAQLARSLGAKVIASPWTPPAWMKSNNNIIGGRINDTSYAAYATHLKSFADYMSDNDVPLHAISVQNEPDVNVNYESCDWTASEMLRFVKENAPAIDTDIIAPESYNFNHTISDAILNDRVAAANISIIGGHIYGGGLDPYPFAISKGKEVWMTEHLDLDTTWTGALTTA